MSHAWYPHWYKVRQEPVKEKRKLSNWQEYRRNLSFWSHVVVMYHYDLWIWNESSQPKLSAWWWQFWQKKLSREKKTVADDVCHKFTIINHGRWSHGRTICSRDSERIEGSTNLLWWIPCRLLRLRSLLCWNVQQLKRYVPAFQGWTLLDHHLAVQLTTWFHAEFKYHAMVPWLGLESRPWLSTRRDRWDFYGPATFTAIMKTPLGQAQKVELEMKPSDAEHG